MESPSYSGPARKKSNTGLIIGIVVAVLFVCCGIGGFGAYFGVKSVAKMAGDMFACGNTMSDYRDALLAYSAKHDGKLPPAKNWMDDIKPYLKPTQLPDILGSTPTAEGVCDAKLPSSVCYNVAFAGKKVDEISDHDAPVLFEVPATGRNLAQEFKTLPFNTSPKLVGNPRGWIEQPLYGLGYMVQQNGRHSAVPKMSQQDLRK